MTQLVDALRAKFKDGRSALRALGLDESLLDSEDTLLRKNADKVINQLLKRFGSTQKVLQKLGMDASMLDEPDREVLESAKRGEHFDPRDGTPGVVVGGRERSGEDKFGLRRSSRDGIPPKVETNEEDLSRDEDLSEEEERALAEHAADMRRRGEDSRVIDHAMRMARDVLRRQRGHADDRRREARDRFPMRHHGDPLVDRGTEARDNWGGEGEPFLADHGLDRRNRHALDEAARVNIRKVVVEPEVRSAHMVRGDRRSMATDKAPSEARQAKTYARYPDLARIGV